MHGRSRKGRIGDVNTSSDESTINLKRVPAELQRGIRMVCARKGMSVRDWLCLTLYQAVDSELNDYPEWRWQSRRGEEITFVHKKRT